MALFFVILGYFGTVSWIMWRSDRRWPVTVMMAAALLVYVPLIGLIIVAVRYMGELGLVLYGLGAVYSLLYCFWKAVCVFRDGAELRPSVAVTLAAYCLALLYITLFIRENGENNQIQMEVFYWIQEGGGRHFMQNIALFVPFGLLAALLPRRRPAWVSGISFGLALSVLIETFQLVYSMGSCDVDDLIANTLGAFLGASIALIWDRCKK